MKLRWIPRPERKEAVLPCCSHTLREMEFVCGFLLLFSHLSVLYALMFMKIYIRKRRMLGIGYYVSWHFFPLMVRALANMFLESVSRERDFRCICGIEHPQVLEAPFRRI